MTSRLVITGSQYVSFGRCNCAAIYKKSDHLAPKWKNIYWLYGQSNLTKQLLFFHQPIPCKYIFWTEIIEDHIQQETMIKNLQSTTPKNGCRWNIETLVIVASLSTCRYQQLIKYWLNFLISGSFSWVWILSHRCFFLILLLKNVCKQGMPLITTEHDKEIVHTFISNSIWYLSLLKQFRILVK